jgi:hypothetical protein
MILCHIYLNHHLLSPFAIYMPLILNKHDCFSLIMWNKKTVTKGLLQKFIIILLKNFQSSVMFCSNAAPAGALQQPIFFQKSCFLIIQLANSHQNTPIGLALRVFMELVIWWLLDYHVLISRPQNNSYQ